MSRRKRKAQSSQTIPPPKPRGPNMLLIGGGIALLALLVLGGVLALRGTGDNQSNRSATPGPIGYSTGCIRVPPFAREMGFGQTAVLDTQSRFLPGMLLYEPGPDGQPLSNPPPYRHPSWGNAGFLSHVLFDRDGAVYTAPAPWISTLNNPPEQANTIYRVDPQTAEMQPLLSLPAAAPPNEANVYGILAMTYDCDTHSLYVSSVAGSTRSQELGRLFRVDLSNKQVSIIRENIDPFGVGVFNTAKGKRLYYALARASKIYSLPLSATGEPIGEPREELDFSDQGVRGNERARRIIFNKELTMSLRLIQFDFTLTAPTDVRQTNLLYLYDQSNDRWILQNTE